MQQDPRQLRRLRMQAARRRRARVGIALAVCAGILVIGGVSTFAWARTRTAPKASPTSSVAPTQPAPGPVATTPAPGASAPAVSAQSTTPTPAAPEDVVPAVSSSAESAAVAKAAVRFPDAPVVKPVSFGQLKPKHKYIAITLDDGYGFQPEMFELLKQYDARCTTFVLGGWASTHKSTLKELDEAGFEIANHTWDHKNLTKLSDAQVESELTRTQKAISAVTGNQAPYMRPPGGATNPRVKRLVADLGYKQVMWNRSFGDSGRGATTKKLYENVVTSNGGIQPGDIILCHWGSKATYKAMKVILPELKSQGYEFVTVSELIADSKGSTSSKK
jgi:peptidoglycan-N-acetylglucosamine deacetylase